VHVSTAISSPMIIERRFLQRLSIAPAFTPLLRRPQAPAALRYVLSTRLLSSALSRFIDS